jgi:hypothetical protein
MRRIFLLAAFGLIGCGGTEFSSDGSQIAGAGAPGIAAGIGGQSGSGGTGGAATGGAAGVPAYGGAPYLALDSTHQYSLVARGLSGDLSGYTIDLTADYHGSDWKFIYLSVLVNGVAQGALTSTSDVNDGSFETYSGTLGALTSGPLSGDKPIGSLVVTPDDLVQFLSTRSTTKGGQSDIVTDVTSATLASPDGSVVLTLP